MFGLYMETTDHTLIDELRNLALIYIRDAKGGAELSATQARIIQTALDAISKRGQIEDPQALAKALGELLERGQELLTASDANAEEQDNDGEA